MFVLSSLRRLLSGRPTGTPLGPPGGRIPDLSERQLRLIREHDAARRAYRDGR